MKTIKIMALLELYGGGKTTAKFYQLGYGPGHVTAFRVNRAKIDGITSATYNFLNVIIGRQKPCSS